MVDDRPSGIVNTSNQTYHKTLLSKYEIPIDHLSYEYINICSDVKELEKIIKILRSGEEGIYPHLESTAEERLRSLSPNHILLRRAEPVLHIDDVDIKERNSVMRDVASWKEEISLKDLRLTQENHCDEVSLPPVRQPPSTYDSNGKKSSADTNKMSKGPKVSDYAVWDKYDAETELLKMELEEERKACKRKKEKEEETKRLENMRIENERLNTIVQEAGKMCKIEREILAEEEKNRGNEYFYLQDYHEAVKYYSASIAVLPTVNAYNNRAAAYIQLGEYYPAADDANSVISMDPSNIKAYYRRAVALKNKGKYEEAHKDVNVVIAKEPHNAMAKQLAEELNKLMCEPPETLSSTLLKLPSKRSRIIELLDDCGETKPNLKQGPTWTKLIQDPNPQQTNKDKGRTSWLPRPGTSTSKATIVELPDEPNGYETTSSSTKLEIVEVQNSDGDVQLLSNGVKKSDSSVKPKKCVVIDKRTNVPGAKRQSCLIQEIS